MSPDNYKRRSEDAWTVLRAGDQVVKGPDILTKPAGPMTCAGQVRCALGEQGELRLLLPLPAGDQGQGVSGAPSLQIRVSTRMVDGKSMRFLDLTCLDRGLESVFKDVTNMILARIGAGEGSVTAARSTIEEFRALLIRPSAAEVALTTITGLVGELLVMNRLLDRSPAAWRTWRGPLGDRHDFRSGDHSLEVKSTIRSGNKMITVSSFEQMEPPTGGDLHLLHFNLENVTGGRLTVAALGHAALLKADEPHYVRERLAALGCTNIDSREWNIAAFRLEAEQLYEVREGFPRLAPSLLSSGAMPYGVADLTYKIDLNAAASFVCDESHAAAVEEDLINCLSKN